MTVISAYIDLFIRGEKSGEKCPGEISGYLNEDYSVGDEIVMMSVLL